jgi:molybdate transport system substrate-binding protein
MAAGRAGPRGAIMASLLGLVVLALAGCAAAGGLAPGGPAAAQPEGRLVVFAAASLTEAFQELGRQFEAGHPGTEVIFNFAGSQQLAQQLAQGAPADVFASANQRQMDAAVAAGRVAKDAVLPFARNRLVVIFPAENPAGLATLQDLGRPGVKLVLAAPEVPAGSYAREFLSTASGAPGFPPGYGAAVLANVVSYEESVRSVLSKVALGEADAGIVYSSDVGAEAAGQVGRLDIPDGLNVVASYPIAAVAVAAHPQLARDLVDFVLSPQGQATLAHHGFEPVAP